MDPALLQKILEAIAASQDDSGLLAEIVKSVAAEEGAEDAPDPMAASADAPPPDPNALPKPGDKPVSASTKSVSHLAKALGCSSDEEAAQVVAKLQKQVNDSAAANAAVELETRRGLIAELVKLGIEKPATAWKGEAEKRVPVERLTVEPIAEMRARVELHKADGPRVPAAAPPSGAPVIKLSKVEQDYCSKNGLSEAEFLAKKASVVKVATK